MRVELATKSFRRRALTLPNNPLVSIVLSVLLTIALRLLIEKALPNLRDFWYVFRRIGIFYVLLIGVGLYLFKKHYQRVFGVSEVLFALVISWIYIARAQILQDAASWIAVIAAAYLIVRGLTNYEDGKKQAIENKL